MKFIGTISVARAANDWLINTHRSRVLHVFDQACNLISDQGLVLSIVTPEIGNGPFNLVIDGDAGFSDDIHIQSVVSNIHPQLTIGNVTINYANAKFWNACPDWVMLHSHRFDILRQLIELETTKLGNSKSPISGLPKALAHNDISSSVKQAAQIAGLGVGLTPAGDDFIMGALYAAWIIHPYEVAARIASAIANEVAPLTTSLSSAWLRSAGNGEAGILWHTFLVALITGEQSTIQFQINNILSVGATSGADALAGFIDTFISYAESEKNHVIPKFIQR